jgi:hypothetical protein
VHPAKSDQFRPNPTSFSISLSALCPVIGRIPGGRDHVAVKPDQGISRHIKPFKGKGFSQVCARFRRLAVKE